MASRQNGGQYHVLHCLYFKIFEKKEGTELFCKTVVCSVPTEVWLQVPAGGEEVVMVYRGEGTSL